MKVAVYHRRGRLPAPAFVLASGPVWARDSIEQFQRLETGEAAPLAGENQPQPRFRPWGKNGHVPAMVVVRECTFPDAEPHVLPAPTPGTELCYA